VSVASGGSALPRLNLTLIWARRARRTLLLISRTSVGNDLEIQLSQQIRDRLILEGEARALAARLERANRDLEEFASIISHDLRAPMRAMRYLIEDAEAAIGTGPAGAEARDKLVRVREQAHRLSGMLGALFDYSRTGHKQDAVQSIDLDALVRTIVRTMPTRPGLVIEVAGQWGVLDTLAAPLDLVVRNLIDNAVKHHDRQQARIEVAAADRGAMLEISVADDGPGIDPRHHATVLLPFRTLAADVPAKASGMGLALVKRTVESVGGRLELHSDPAVARGATFKVFWPRTIAG
jgi:signal transduction histidine kinase